jgi:hypothetical protein
LVTESSSIPGYRVLVEKRQIGVVAESRSEAELALRRKAARLGANAVTKLTSITRREKYQAGVGPKGNPYFRTRDVVEWEACAVAAVEERRVRWWRRIWGSKPEKLAVIDGSNVLHAAGEGPNLASVRTVVGKLAADGWVAHVFFDANIGYKVFNRHASEPTLARALGLQPRQVTIVPSGRQADPFVISFARRHDGVIVSNDLYRDNLDMMRGLPRLGVTFSGRDPRLN